METAAASKHTELCEKLLQFFVDENLNSCFGACLFMSLCPPTLAPQIHQITLTHNKAARVCAHSHRSTHAYPIPLPSFRAYAFEHWQA
jgi:hypothetical protein